MGDIRPYKDQVYETLKYQHNSSQLFVDRKFPAAPQSLFPSGNSILKSGKYVNDIIWRRPIEFCDNPQFVVDGFKCGDLDQGELGNCWFIAAANALALHPDLHERTVPPIQSFDANYYAGIFHFRFCLYGQWYDVVIDDQLPWHPDIGLVFGNNRVETNEMWAPLLEKAYAKLCGSYEAIIGGRLEEALIDMTGGIGEAIKFATRRAQVNNLEEDIKQKIWQAYKHDSILGCSISDICSPTYGGEAKLANGLIAGHTYAITGVEDLMTSSGPVTLIRCLNPWGNQEEWKGKFSDSSNIWNEISDAEKQKLHLKKQDDGEFWMSLDDFLINFAELQICHQTLACFQQNGSYWGNEILTWKETMFHGSWISDVTAGGSGNDHPENFWKNPQYLVRLNLSDDVNNDKLCTMIIFLMIKVPHERYLRRGENKIQMQFRVHKVQNDNDVQEYIEQGNFKFRQNQLQLVKDTGTYINSPALSLRIDAEPGSYVIIPSTFNPNTPGEFLLRVFTEAPLDSKDLGKNKSDSIRSYGDSNKKIPSQPINSSRGRVPPTLSQDIGRKNREDNRGHYQASDEGQPCSTM